MNTHYELKKVMQIRLAELKAKNTQYSLRAYAKHLGVHAASLSEFFNDKRQFSSKLAKRIIERMNLSPDQKNCLLAEIEGKTEKTRPIKRIQIDTDNYFLVADPIYYSILCLIETKDFREDENWIANRLNTSAEKVEIAIQRLFRLNMLKRNSDGSLFYNAEGHLGTSDDIANASLKLRHADNLEQAKLALLNLPVSERYFNFETLAVSKAMLPEMKKIINDCRNKLVQLSSQGEKDEVYEFCFNFFPRSLNKNETENSNLKLHQK